MFQNLLGDKFQSSKSAAEMNWKPQTQQTTVQDSILSLSGTLIRTNLVSKKALAWLHLLSPHIRCSQSRYSCLEILPPEFRSLNALGFRSLALRWVGFHKEFGVCRQ